MSHVERLFTPDLFVVGGGISKNADKWVPLLELNTPVEPAQLLNNAGIVGAAIAVVERRAE
jgi:polyphosphate glucokinase